MPRKPKNNEVSVPVSMRLSTDWNQSIIPSDTIDENNTTLITLKGLERLAYKAGLIGVKTQLNTYVVPMLIDNLPCDVPLIQAVVTANFNDGTSWDGAGDANPTSTSPAYFRYCTAVAESRALSRALKRALSITMLAKEEIGFQDVSTTTPAVVTDKVAEPVVKSIEAYLTKNKLDPMTLFNNILSPERLGLVPTVISSIKDLTIGEGAVALKFLQGYKA